MRTFATVILASSAVLAQEVGFSDGPSVASGSNAISNPNVNNGWQSDSSLFAGAGQGGASDVFNNVVGSSFTNVNSNSAIKDNLVNNPSAAFVKGNDGWTANGDANALGPVQSSFGAGVFRRGGDVVFADNHHQASAQVATNVVPQANFVQPGFVAPAFTAPQFAPAYPHGAVGAVYRRGGDVVFADNHRQVDTAAANFIAQPQVPWNAPFVTQSVPFVHTVAQPVAVPVAAEQNGQKATVVQNQA
ncbi:hypothetical protein H4R20_002709 [Coemansia guatemalensis]|uniref:Uncharacterized protein n=1 Tax=Coemansia guatemalensis TaxID=2761395 RepID=A0A9W8HWP8_9FUNG|nr:hypothetical protein H4R20_002709 [Coemansia guatemalensis]